MPDKRTSFEIIQLVYFNHQKGKSVQELSEMFSLTRQTIYNILNRAKKEDRLQPRLASGRPRKISERTERVLLRKVDGNPQISTRRLASELQKECGIAVSHETIRQVIKRNQYTSRVARKKPLLSSENIEKRLKFSRKYIGEPNDFWIDVIFCDETKMMLYYNDGPNRVWRK